MRNALRSSILLGVMLASVPSRAEAPAASRLPRKTTASLKIADRGSGRATSESVPAPSDPVADLYSKAQHRYLEGDVEAALRFMEQCYELSHRPNLLYNLAQIYRELNRCEPALKNYQQYLKESPNGERRQVAEQYVRELVKQCPPKESTSNSSRAAVVPAPLPQGLTPVSRVAPMQTTPSERVRYWTPMRYGGLVLTAIGVAAAVGGVYYAVQARQATLDAERTLRAAKANPALPVWEDQGGSARKDDYQYDQKLAIVFGGVSLTALGVGIAALFLVPSTPAERHRHASLTLTPNALGGGYRWDF